MDLNDAHGKRYFDIEIFSFVTLLTLLIAYKCYILLPRRAYIYHFTFKFDSLWRISCLSVT